jgi:hypothetical protein
MVDCKKPPNTRGIKALLVLGLGDPFRESRSNASVGGRMVLRAIRS